MRKKSKLEPNIIITYSTNNIDNIPIVITDSKCNILHMEDVSKQGPDYLVRIRFIKRLMKLQEQFNVDTIVMEKNKLFIDKIDKYPDPLVLKDVLLGYGLQISVENTFYDTMLLIAYPEYEWKKFVLNNRVKYAIDLYKSHILYRSNITKEQLEIINLGRYYESVCLSESILFGELLDNKYQINKGE